MLGGIRGNIPHRLRRLRLLPISNRCILAQAVRRAFDGVESFAEALSSFLVPLPTTFRFGVEIRHAQLLEPEYFRALRENCVAHVFNSWTEMPGIDQQMNHNEAFTANFTAARALLVRQGRLRRLLMGFQGVVVDGQFRRYPCKACRRMKRTLC